MAEIIAPGIIRMRIALPKSPLKYTNSYVIMGERPLVVDTAFNRSECEVSLRQEMAEAGISCEGTDLFLTHFHSDHAGLARLWNNGTSKIYMSETDARLARATSEGRTEAERKSYRKTGMPAEELALLESTHPGFYYASRDDIDYTICTEDEIFHVGDYAFRCIPVPGHTPGHMCLYDEKSGILIGGDHILFDITPNIVEWDCMPDSLGEYRKSLMKIRALDIRQVLPGHRESGDPYARIDRLLVHHDARLAEVTEIVRVNPGITGYEITSKLTWDIRAKGWDDFPMTQKWFAIGEAEAHISYLVGKGMIRKEEDEAGVRRYYSVL